jgi:hypothetical protein
MTVEATNRNRARRIKADQRRKDRDEAKRNVRRAKRALGALRRFEKYLPARMKDAAGDAGQISRLRDIHSTVASAFHRDQHFIAR